MVKMTHQSRRLTALECPSTKILNVRFWQAVTNYSGIETLHVSARSGQQENIAQDAQYIRLASRET
jgi:hypothetical protein